jgi:hypothetical protein
MKPKTINFLQLLVYLISFAVEVKLALEHGFEVLHGIVELPNYIKLIDF